VQLWSTIQQQLAREAPQAGPAARRLTRRRVWISCGALVALLLLVWLGRRWIMPPPPAVVQEMVDSHIRTRLMAAPYTQIPASPEAIRAWFRDKVEFAVPVLNLPPERYALLGVRLNYFLNRRVAELAYTTDTHVLSLFMFTEPGLSPQVGPTVQVGPRMVSVHRQKGYTAVLWQDGDLVCGLVSDLHATALVALLQQALPGHTAS
jgi:anti-sigma factor RsiW